MNNSSTSPSSLHPLHSRHPLHPSGPLRIRRARLSDIDQILELLRQVNLVHVKGRPDLFQIATKYTRTELLKRLEALDDPVFVACSETDENRIFGHMFCENQDHTHDGDGTSDGQALFQPIKTLHIDDLCVNETARGAGVGRALLHFAQNWARERGYYNITLGVWQCNPAARGFYEAMGMQPQETIMETIL